MKFDKERLSYIFAAVSLLFGFGLTLAGFIVDPLGIISESVLWVLGQCFIFAGAVCGISMHIDNSLKKMKAELKNDIENNK